jgi:tetratricopeptide (TPR) repeat protein
MKRSLFVILIAFSYFGFSQNCDSLYLQSLKSFDKEQYKESISIVETCIASCPQDSKYYMHAAKCYYQIHDYEKTLAQLNIALSIDDSLVPAYALKARLLTEAQLYDAAIVCYEKILALVATNDNTTELYRINLSNAYLNTNQYEKAYALLKGLYTPDSQNLELITNLSVCCMNLDKKDEAEMYLQKILAIQPDFTAGLINMGFYLTGKGEYQKAIDCYSKVIVIQPNEAYALNNRGFAFYKLTKYDLALQDINQSISIDPSNSYAFKNRALVYFKTGLMQEACLDLQKALDLGYTKMYGDEVLILQKEACPQNKGK